MNNNIEKIVNDIKDIVDKKKYFEFIELYLYENGFEQRVTSEDGVYYIKGEIKVVLLDQVVVSLGANEYRIEGISYDSWMEEKNNGRYV